MTLAVVAIALAALGALALLGAGISRLRHGRVAAGWARGGAGCVLLAIAAAASGIALELHTYERLTHERPVASVSLERAGTAAWRVRLRLPGAPEREFALRGDEWQLDARVLKWRGLANLLGLDALYRLERLSGRYADVERERIGPRTVYRLADSPGIDLWTLARRSGRRLPLVDALYGSATYLPLAEGARYEVRMTQAGLVARAANRAAERAVSGWN